MSNIKLPTLPPLPISINDICRSRSTHEFTPNAHWVIPNILMQGCRPDLVYVSDNNDDDMTLTFQEQVRKIVKDGGCRTFVCAQAE